MVSKPARVRGRSVATLLLGALMALIAVMPFAGAATAQDATPEAEAPSGLAALGLQEIAVTATDTTFVIAFAPPLVEGWALVTLTNESAAPAVANFAQLSEEQSVGDLTSAVFSAFKGEGGELPAWWSNTTFSGGAWAGAGETTQTAIYITPGNYAVFGTNPLGVQPVQQVAVASADDLVNIYGMEAEATPVADAGATPVVEGLPADGTLSITDGAFVAGAAPVAGPQVWAVTNDSSQVSELVLVSVDYAISPEDAVLWAPTFAAGDLGSAVIENGTGLMGPGETVYVSLDLAPGTYILFSASPDAAGGIQSSNGLNLVITIEG